MFKRRDLFKKIFAGLGLMSLGCAQVVKKPEMSGSRVFPHDKRKVESGIEQLVEDVNFYFYAVFTHVMSLRRRRCLEVDIRAVKEASYSIMAIMNNQLKDFEITEWKIEDGYGKINYTAVFIIDNTWTEKINSSFYFGLLGKPGDPVWIEKNAGYYSVFNGKVDFSNIKGPEAANFLAKKWKI